MSKPGLCFFFLKAYNNQCKSDDFESLVACNTRRCIYNKKLLNVVVVVVFCRSFECYLILIHTHAPLTRHVTPSKESIHTKRFEYMYNILLLILYMCN